MRRVINEAARVGVVIYSLGTRPNVLGSGTLKGFAQKVSIALFSVQPLCLCG